MEDLSNDTESQYEEEKGSGFNGLGTSQRDFELHSQQFNILHI